jgi:hypothetical protein
MIAATIHNLAENIMATNTHFLRRVLAIDSIGTAAIALGVVVTAGPLSAALGIPAPWLAGIGIALLPFAAWVGWLARQSNPPRKHVWVLIAANDLWVATSVVIAFSSLLPLTALGIEFLVIQALLAAVMATLEFVAIRRVANNTQSFA